MSGSAPFLARIDWQRYCKDYADYAINIDMQFMERAEYPEIDWLAVAIAKLGGPDEAGPKIGVSRSRIYVWLKNGIAGANHGAIRKLSRLTHVPMEYLREGPVDLEAYKKRFKPEPLAARPPTKSKGGKKVR